MLGKTLGHYRILEKLGEGGMGVVYRAHDEQLERDVAIKVLPASSFRDATARALLLREARTAAALNHPNICTIHEVGEADGQAYIAMEFVQGQPLSVRLAAGALPAEQVLRYGLQLADALAHAHERGVTHRDLKSANVMLTSEGRAKVLDFGLAKRMSGEELAEVVTQSQATLTQPGVMVGTLPYMAPEQLRCQAADARSDVWALGVVLYEMAAGRRPFQGQTPFELSAAILNQPPPPLPAAAQLQAVMERCLEKEPAQRYQRGGEVRAALEAVQSGVAVTPPVRPRPSQLTRRQGLALAVAAVVVAAVLLWLNAGRLRERLGGAPSAPRIESLAVLPLKNLMGDPAQEYFVEGMQEALITELSKISALKVISRTSAMRYKQTDKPLPQVARELNVDAVIEGSVLREGDQVRITVQLIHGPTDRHLWAQSFDRELRGILALHSQVARAIAGEIKLKLTPQEQTRLASARLVHSESYQAYLRGRYHIEKRTEEDVRKAAEHFQQAIQKDPTFALAYAGLADCYNLFSLYAGIAPKEAFPKAKAAAAKALELDEALAEAHTGLAWAKLVYDWDWRGGEAEFKRALELNPNYAPAHHWYGLELVWVGKSDQGLAEVKRARELDPVSGVINRSLGMAFHLSRQHDIAIDQLKKTLELDPNFSGAHAWLGLAYVQKRMYQEAITALENSVELGKDSRSTALGRLGYAYAMAGQRAQALAVVDQLKGLSKRKYVSAFDFAVVYAGLREKDQASLWLEKAYEERATELPMMLKVDPRFDSLRPDPRFQDLLRRMNFPQ